MSEITKKQKKEIYAKNLTELLKNYNRVLLVAIDFVGAYSIQKMRQALRGKAHILFGKNTLIRKTIRDYIEKMQEAGNQEVKISELLPFIRGNVGMIFTNENLREMKETIESFKQQAAAKSGVLAPSDVYIEAGPTGLEPTQTTFLQALNISSKIVKGQIEILSRVHLIKAGEKVGASEAVLCDKLNIMPFTYNAQVKTVFDAGFVYPASLLTLGENEVMQMFAKGVTRLACISLQIGIPTVASIPHLIATAYRNLVSISCETEYEFEGSKKVREFLKDPSAFVSSNAPPPSTTTETTAPVQEKEPEKEEESAEIGGLFGDDDDF